MTEDNINTLIYTIGIVAILWMLKSQLIGFFSRMSFKFQRNAEVSVVPDDQFWKEGNVKQPSEQQHVFHSVIFKGGEEGIKMEIDAIKNLNAEGKINLLISQLSGARMITTFWRISRLISKNEIELLNNLNKEQRGWEKEKVESHYRQVVRISSETVTRSAEESVDLLLFLELIKIEKGFYHVDDFGIDFLTWLKIREEEKKKREKEKEKT